MIVKIIILIGLTRLLSATKKPLLCSGIYTGIVLFFSLLGEDVAFLEIVIGGVIVFLLSSLYFWLLDRFEDNIPIYFAVLTVGLLIGLV
jgi:hypothetical protein